MTVKTKRQNLQGNHACALGAIAANCRFFAGYPITPSSEIAEQMAEELLHVGGVFVQMEDEIASMGAVLGASIGGIKAMTATSGPGFSLKQENLGFGMMAEIPCVVVNVMRGGPSTGMPTRPSQGDIMQSRWGTHGDHPAIVLAPASVEEIYLETIRAFNLSEAFRMPVTILYDEVVGHLIESVELIDAPDLIEREWAQEPREEFKPYAAANGQVQPMARPGDGYRTHMTGLTHGEDGFPSQDPKTVTAMMKRLLGKLDHRREEIDSFKRLFCEDVEVLVVAIGITARAAQRAVVEARQQGIKAGLFRPVTLWPFPETPFQTTLTGVSHILVPEMNAGQLTLEVERLCQSTDVVISRLNRIDGQPIAPAEILNQINGLI